MIVHNVAQGSREWLQVRLGIPTASEFKKIVTPTGKLSAQARAYAHRLCAEKLLNGIIGTLDGQEWIERGKTLESEAVSQYEFERDVSAKTVGFCTTDDGEIGASPDRLIGEDGLLEIKCPAPQTHIGYLLDGMDKDYIPQVQGQLFVTGRKWCDWYSYNPAMPSVRVRVERDEEFIGNLAQALSDFVQMKNGFMKRLLDLGAYGASEFVSTPVDRAWGEEVFAGG